MTRSIDRPRSVSYIDRSRDFYAAQGYRQPYRWPSFETVPFVAPADLSRLRVGVVTTAELPDGQLNRPFHAPAEPPPERLDTDRLSWDKDATHTDDVETFLPLRALDHHRAAGRVGSLSSRFYGVPTLYSQRRTSQRDAPQVLEWCREDAVDVALLVPL